MTPRGNDRTDPECRAFRKGGLLKVSDVTGNDWDGVL